jgi:oligopeptide/dipeptide ABC transporter ATP-binding protein
VDTIDITIPHQNTLGLVGESGCGKSTVAKAIAGLVSLAAGTIELGGKAYTEGRAHDSAEFKRKVQIVFQDPYSSLNPRMTIGEALGEGLQVRRIPRPARRAETMRLLDLVGLPRSAVERYPHQFSGGQRQRIAIARALTVGPDLILLDEVTAALDVSVQATILNLLKTLQKDLGLTYLYISHDLSSVQYMSNQVAVMYLGRIVETASSEQLFRSPCHPYTQALIASAPVIGVPRAAAPLSSDIPDPRTPPSGCRFHPRCPVGPLVDAQRTVCTQSDPQLGAFGRLHLTACHFAETAFSTK